MSNFDKFMKDIEEKMERAKQRRESVSRDNKHHNQRERVQRYAERWQNSIRWVRRGGNNES